MKTKVPNPNNKRKCGLSHNWLIIVTTSIGLTITGCVPPINHTTGERIGKQEITMYSGKFVPRSSKTKREKTLQNKINSEEELIENELFDNDDKSITEFEKKLLKKKQDENSLNENSKQEKKLPSLKEQIEKLDQKQIMLEESIDGLKENIYEIKEMLGNMDNIQRYPTTGKEQNSKSKTKSEKSNIYESTFIIDSDEEIDDSLIEIMEGLDIPSDEATSNNQQKNNPQKTEKKKVEAPKKIEVKPKTIVKNNNANATTSEKSKSKPVANNAENSVDEPATSASEKEEAASNVVSQSTANFSDIINKIAKKEYAAAVKQINEIQESSKDPNVLANCNYWLGECYFNQRDYAKAIACFKSVLASNIDKKDVAQSRIAESYVRVGKTEEAKIAYQTLLRDFPKSSQIPTARKMLQQL